MAYQYPSRFPNGLEATYVNTPYGQNTAEPAWDGGDFRMGPNGPYYANNPGDPNYHAPGSTPFPASGATAGDPTSIAKGFLGQVMSGQQTPYDQATQDNMMTKASDMNASAETARNSEFGANAAINGAALSDPSLAGARMNSMARRQTDNSMAANNIAQNANKANFSAKLSAAGSLANIGMAEENRALELQKAVMDGQYDNYRAPASPYPGYDMGNNPPNGGFGNGMRMSAPLQQQQAPQQAQPWRDAAAASREKMAAEAAAKAKARLRVTKGASTPAGQPGSAFAGPPAPSGAWNPQQTDQWRVQ